MSAQPTVLSRGPVRRLIRRSSVGVQAPHYVWNEDAGQYEWEGGPVNGTTRPPIVPYLPNWSMK